tara:strand:+ start:320 stop:1096 length:777 start_codon:yes stop_codon:yes gene_type:complete
MAYFQGRDVKVAFTTEMKYAGILNTNGTLSVINNGTVNMTTTVGDVKNRLWPRHQSTAFPDTGKGTIGLVDADVVAAGSAASGEENTLSDLTGIDVSMDKTNEDISYFGQNTMLQAEIKNAYTISITRKKTDNLFEALYNQARMGIINYTTSGKTIQTTPDDNAERTNAQNTFELVSDGGNASVSLSKWQNMGYRVHVKEKHSGAIMSFRNCCIQGYSVSLSPDGIQEETIEFYSEVDAKHDGDGVAGNVTLTAATEL